MGIYAISRTLYGVHPSFVPYSCLLQHTSGIYVFPSIGIQKGRPKKKNKKKGKRGVEPILERAIECRFRFGTCWLIQFAGAPGAPRAAFYVTLYAYGVPMEWVCSLQSPTIWHDTPCHIMGFRLEPTFISVFQHRPKPPRDTTETLPRQPLTSTVNFIRCF